MRNAKRMAQVLALASSLAGGAAMAASSTAVLGDNIFVDRFENYPILRYLFDGDGSNSGTLAGYTMTVVDSTFGTGKVGQGVTFSSSSSYGYVAGMKAALGTSAEVTVAFWFYETAPLPTQGFWSDINRSSAPYGGVQLGEGAGGISVCVATTTNSLLGGACANFASPGTGAWHHWIIRYAGTGPGAGQGGPTEIYVDDVLKLTQANDGSNSPVFSTGIDDVMYIGGSGATMDELKIYSHAFTQAEQCTIVIGGSWTGSSCTLP